MNIGKLSLPAVAQVSLVVNSINDYIKKLALVPGFHGFDVYDFLPDIALVEGTEIPDFKLKIAIGYFVNGVQFELIEPINDGGFYSNFIKERGSGIHHMGFFVENLEEWRNYFLINGGKICFEADVKDEVRGRRRVFYSKVEELDCFFEFVQRG